MPKDARLVVDHAEGTRHVYQVDREGLALLRTYTSTRCGARALAGFQAAAAEPEPAAAAGPPTTTDLEEER